jgi:hypothetical protein
MLLVLSRLPGKLQDPRLVHTASRTRLLVFRPHHASWLRHHPAAQLYLNPAMCRVYSSSRLHRLYCAYVVHLDAPSRHSTSRWSLALALAVRPVTASRGATTRRPDCTSSTAPMPCIWARRLAARLLVGRLAQARRRLLRLRRTSGCLGTSRSSSRGSSRRSSSTTPPRAGSSSTTPSRVRVPRHVARLVTRLVVPLVVHYIARPGASARRAARHAARRAARHRLLRLRRASVCLGTSRGSSRGSSCRSSSTTPRVRVPRHVARLVTRLVVPLVVDYFAHAACPGASARRAARHAARRRLLRLAQARRRLLRLRRASRCLDTSRGSSHDSSRCSLSITPPRRGLVVDYFAHAARPGASARRAVHHATHR